MFCLVDPEPNTGGDLALELARLHIRLMPAIVRDYPAIGLGRGVDDHQDGAAFVVATRPDEAHVPNLGIGALLLLAHGGKGNRTLPPWCCYATTTRQGSNDSAPVLLPRGGDRPGARRQARNGACFSERGEAGSPWAHPPLGLRSPRGNASSRQSGAGPFS